jgi:hypothetical protein
MSLRRLRLERIDLYQFHRVDPQVPIEESVGALKELQDQGKIRHIGVSNFSADELDKALRLARVVSVQNRYNVADRSSAHHAVKPVIIPPNPLAASGEDSSVATSHLHHDASLPNRQRFRLFAIYIFAMPHGLGGYYCMPMVRCSDENRIDVAAV